MIEPINRVKVESISTVKVWIESDMLGARHVVIQHDGARLPPFIYATFHYNYAYTSNYATLQAAELLAIQLGATVPVEHRTVAVAGQS